MNYFDSATVNGILSLHYQIRETFAQTFADKQFAEEINATINKLKFPKKAAKISPLTFSIVHLFHHLYGVDARSLQHF